MENVLFKISFPAEFHAQTAVECAIQLHPNIKDRLEAIEKVIITTQESAIRIISKRGPLHNPADRDHCLQYMAAIGLLFGELNADHYEDKIASDPRIDVLRETMEVNEDKQFSRDYLDPEKRSIANAIEIHFRDGSKTEKVTIEYPLGHRTRRAEGIPQLEKKFTNNLATKFSKNKVDEIITLCFDQKRLEQTAVVKFLNTMCPTQV